MSLVFRVVLMRLHPILSSLDLADSTFPRLLSSMSRGMNTKVQLSKLILNASSCSTPKEPSLQPASATKGQVMKLRSWVRRIYRSSATLQCVYQFFFTGTEAVVYDIEYISLLLEGSAPINYWGFSYGTIIGQYLVQIIPPNRLGKI